MGHVKGFSVAAFLTEVTQARQRVWPHGSTRGSRDPVTYTSEQTEQVTASSILVEDKSDKKSMIIIIIIIIGTSVVG